MEATRLLRREAGTRRASVTARDGSELPKLFSCSPTLRKSAREELERSIQTETDVDRRFEGLVALARRAHLDGRPDIELSHLDEIKRTGSPTYRLVARCRSLAALNLLGRYAESTDELTLLLPELSAASEFSLLHEAWYHAGHTYAAIGLWHDALRYLGCAYLSVEATGSRHMATLAKGAVARLGALSTDANERSCSERLLREVITDKLGRGDVTELSRDLLELSRIEVRSRRWASAFTCVRRASYFADLEGDALVGVRALLRRSTIYLRLHLLSLCRNTAMEARERAVAIGGPVFADHVEDAGRLLAMADRAGRRGKLRNTWSSCVCGSSRTFEDCCGRADRDAVEADFGPAALAEHHASKWKPASDLNSFLGSDCHSVISIWSDGTRSEVSCLPNMSYAFHQSAKISVQMAEQCPNELHGGLAATLLSISALEAFINSVTFFAATDQARAAPAADKPNILDKAHAYQEKTELRRKWTEMGRALCGEGWLSKELDESFVRLLRTRNGLVHFKIADWERYDDPGKHEFTTGLPNDVVLRDTPLNWPSKLMTPSFARWAVEIAEKLMNAFKTAYQHNRRACPKEIFGMA